MMRSIISLNLQKILSVCRLGQEYIRVQLMYCQASSVLWQELLIHDWIIKMKKKLLFICYYYWPDMSIAAVRPTKIIKYLENNYEITVLTRKREGSFSEIYGGQFADHIVEIEERPIIVSLLIDGFRKTRLYHLLREKELNNYDNKMSEKSPHEQRSSDKSVQQHVDTESYINNKSFLRKMSENLLQIQSCYIRDRSYAKAAKKYISHHKEEFSIFDGIISTYSPMSSHVIANSIRALSSKAVWIADFRDPPILPGQPLLLKSFYMKWMHIVDKKANWITIVSDGSKKEFSIMHIDKIKVINNGFDPDDNEIIANTEESENTKVMMKHKDALKFLYTGNMYMEKSNIVPLFNTIAKLISSGTIKKDKVFFYYAGSDFAIISRQAKACGIDECVVNLGVVNRVESLKLQSLADVLVLASWNTNEEKGVITGKFYEYLSANKPIICCMTGNCAESELKIWIEQHNLGTCYEEISANEDADRLSKFVSIIYKEVCFDKKTYFDPDEEFISRFSYSNIATDFFRLLENRT